MCGGILTDWPAFGIFGVLAGEMQFSTLAGSDIRETQSSRNSAAWFIIPRFPACRSSAIVGPRFFQRNVQIYISGEKSMSILAWIVLGLIAGFIGSKIVNKSR